MTVNSPPAIINEMHIALAGLVRGRAHPVAFPPEVTFPAIRYTMVASDPDNVMAGKPGFDRTRWRIELFSVDWTEVIDIAKQIRDAMDELSTQALCVGEFDMYEDDTKLFHRVLDFSLSIVLTDSAV